MREEGSARGVPLTPKMGTERDVVGPETGDRKMGVAGQGTGGEIDVVVPEIDMVSIERVPIVTEQVTGLSGDV